MVTADAFSRSFQGVSALLNRRPDALSRFEISAESFWDSFAAVALTAPAYVVALALARHRLGLPGPALFDDPGLAALVAAGHIASFLALPLAMIGAARRFGFGPRCVPFVIVTNWLAVFASFALALPGALLVLGLETPALAALFTAAFGAVALFVQWHATRATLGAGPLTAAAITGLGLCLATGAHAVVQALV